MPNSQDRKLAAILFADIVGYTAMMQANEAAALSKLEHYRAQLQALLEKYNGELIKDLGDGNLCVFQSANNAVSFAFELQQALQGEIEVPLRIGIHSGDIVVKNQDVYGDRVNVASRIETMGIAGAVLFSKRIWQDIKNQPQFRTKLLEKFNAKNVEEPIEVYALANEGFPVPRKGDIQGKFLIGKLFRCRGRESLCAGMAISE